MKKKTPLTALILPTDLKAKQRGRRIRKMLTRKMEAR